MHRAWQRSQYIVVMLRLWPHTARRLTHLLQKFGWVVHHPPYSPNLAPSDFHLFLDLKKFLSDQHQRFQNDREAEMSVTVVPISDGRLLRHRIQKFVAQHDKCFNSGSEYVENSSILSWSVPINLSINGFCFCKRPQGNLL